MAAHYDAWADAPHLAGTNTEELKRYAEVFDAGSVALDRPPRSPLQDVLAGLRAVGDRAAVPGK